MPDSSDSHDQAPSAPLAPPRPFFLAGSGPRSRPGSTGSAYSDSSSRPPPSAFPFQAYPGNPDPLPFTFGRRRASLESLANGIPAYAYTNAYADSSLPRAGSLSDLHRPQAPFMANNSETGPLTTSSSSSSLYRASAAAQIASPPTTITRSPSQTFRAPFLSPASRPASSLSSWTPPPPPPAAPDASTSALPLATSRSNLQLHRPPLPSTLLVRDGQGSARNSNLNLHANDEKAAAGAETYKDKDLIEKEKENEGRDGRRDARDRAAWWLTLACLLLGAAASALLCWTGIRDVKSRMLDESGLCLVMDENFEGGQLDDTRWGREVEAGGFGNHEFQMTTTSDKNVYIRNGQLYIMPTLTKDEVPDFDADGKTYDLQGCTASVPAPPPSTNSTSGNGNSTSTGNVNGHGNGSGNGGNGNGNGRPTSTNSTGNGNANARRAPPAGGASNNTSSSSGPSTNQNPCRAMTDYSRGTVVNPVMSGRISTRGKVGIKYGRVEVRAKVSRGDWLWPAVWMLPENNTYGAWPLSGEIDILESRGNSPTYPAQGVNYVRSTLTYGLDKTLVPIAVQGGAQPEPLTKQLYGWYALKRTAFSSGFHTYAVEWDERFIRFWVDSRVRSVLDISVGRKGGKGSKGAFWDRGKFPPTAQNASTGGVVVVQNPWEEGSAAAPFDQRFYLIIDLAVGGTSGWFPDEKGDKPWYDGSTTAMRDFARAQDSWYATWPENPDDRAFRIDSVKMWSREC
ncbi:putative glycosyl hydrolases family 16 [Lyophyllum shimeji]|uniref:Glycosyl hydrolases family 16 n=1 Tax=Lyophyllum shimeji TaxID=47721 RepID=A0A9P3PTI7_LYOSH|nr:putative glycosyl hydrolases family 16 [Lyophyllum shimeji]